MFYAGHKCFERMLANKEEGLIPISMGFDVNEGYDLYDFKEFLDLKKSGKQNYKKFWSLIMKEKI